MISGRSSNARVLDLLPAGIVGRDYVPGSTLITYPNLVQDTVEPSADPAVVRTHGFSSGA